METTNLTKQEKHAISKVLLDIVHADGEASHEESNYLMNLSTNLGISEDEIDESRHMKAVDCLLTIRNLPDDRKKKLTVAMLKLIGVDGKITEKEMDVLNMVSLSAGMPPLGAY